MDGEDKIEAVSKVSKDLETAKKVEKEPFDQAKADKFQQALEGAELVQATEAQQVEQAKIQKSPMDVAKDQLRASDGAPPPIDRISETTDAIKARIEDIKGVLESGDVHIKQSYQDLLENKLSHIDDSLKIALEKAGVEYTPVDHGATVGIPTALERFVSFLTRSQSQLDNVASEVQAIRDKHEGTNKNINPADLLAIQVKVQFVQQELELFTNLLNKGLESTKTLMNVQV